MALPSKSGEKRWPPAFLPTVWKLHLLVGSAVMLLVGLFGDPFELLENRWLDQYERWRFAVGWSPSVDSTLVHLGIDDQDLRSLTTLESEYAAAARIIEEASALGAKVVSFDVIFQRGDARVAGPLLDAIARSRAKIVLAEAWAPASLGAESAGLLGHDSLQRVRSFPFRERLGVPAGLINVLADPDGVHRHYPMLSDGTLVGRGSAPAESEPSLALAAYLAWRDVKWKGDVTISPKREASWQELSPRDFTSLISRTVPAAPLLLNFRGPWSAGGATAFPHLTLKQLDALAASDKTTTGTRPWRPLENKIVVVGYVALGTEEVGQTAFGTHEPLVHLHSTAINDLIQGNWLRRSSRWLDATLMWLLTSVFAASANACRRRYQLVVLWLIGTAAIAVLGAGCFLTENLVLPAVLAAGLWTLCAVAEMVRRYGAALLDRVRLHATMSYYFSPRVLAAVLRSPGAMEPRKVQIAVLLTDVRNSTPLAERLGAQEFFDLLNRVFEVQTRAVLGEDGSMEHFLGDQFLSYWGAPDPQPDAPERSLRAARALIEGMNKLRASLPPEVAALFGYGVALHYGPALIGNKGSVQRMDYGVVGDLINTAARVESLTKVYGACLLVTGEFYALLPDPRPGARLLDRVVVKGKSTPLDVIEIAPASNQKQWSETAAKYSEAFAKYLQEKFSEAAVAFEILARQTGDPASIMLAERCRALILDSPTDWDGVYKFQTK